MQDRLRKSSNFKMLIFVDVYLSELERGKIKEWNSKIFWNQSRMSVPKFYLLKFLKNLELIRLSLLWLTETFAAKELYC